MVVRDDWVNSATRSSVFRGSLTPRNSHGERATTAHRPAGGGAVGRSCGPGRQPVAGGIVRTVRRGGPPSRLGAAQFGPTGGGPDHDRGRPGVVGRAEG